MTLDSSARARRVVRASALYDLLVTLPLATPWTARGVFSAFTALHVRFAASGAPPVVEGPVAMLLANLVGSLVVVWAVVRLLRPSAELGLADTVARVLFATWMAVAIAGGASGVLAVYLVPEVLWGIVQGAAVLGLPSRARTARVAV